MSCVCVAAEVHGRNGVRQGVAVQPQSQDAVREGDMHIQRARRARLHRSAKPVLSQELLIRRRLDCQGEFLPLASDHIIFCGSLPN